MSAKITNQINLMKFRLQINLLYSVFEAMYFRFERQHWNFYGTKTGQYSTSDNFSLNWILNWYRITCLISSMEVTNDNDPFAKFYLVFPTRMLKLVCRKSKEVQLALKPRMINRFFLLKMPDEILGSCPLSRNSWCEALINSHLIDLDFRSSKILKSVISNTFLLSERFSLLNLGSFPQCFYHQILFYGGFCLGIFK